MMCMCMCKMQNFRNHDIFGTFFTVIIRPGFFTLKASKTFHKNKPMGRLSNVDRHRALGMVEGGLSYRQVAERRGCSHTTIARLVERHNATGSVDVRQRPERERVTTRQQDRYIVLSHLRDRFRTSVETAQETVGTHYLRVSALTVRRRLQERGISSHKTYRGNALTAERRISRFSWCRQRIRWTQQRWRGVLFTDESRFCVEMFDRRR